MKDAEKAWANHMEQWQNRNFPDEIKIERVYMDKDGLQIIEVNTGGIPPELLRKTRITYGDLDGDWDCLSANDPWAVLATQPDLPDQEIWSIAIQIATQVPPHEETPAYIVP